MKKTYKDGIEYNYSFNADGLRIEKAGSEDTTVYMYEYNKVVMELDADGNMIAKNIYGTNLLTRTVEGETLYYMYNGHADVTALIDTEGNVVGSYYYDVWGNIIESDGEMKDKNSILYAGYQYDSETDLYYLNARMYDPKIARFLQEDTYRGNVKDPLSLNLYTYCHNEPIMYFDPSGNLEMRRLAEANDGKVSWDDDKKIATIMVNGKTMRYKVDNGQVWEYDAEKGLLGKKAGTIINGRIDVTDVYFVDKFYNEWKSSSGSGTYIFYDPTDKNLVDVAKKEIKSTNGPVIPVEIHGAEELKEIWDSMAKGEDRKSPINEEILIFHANPHSLDISGNGRLVVDDKLKGNPISEKVKELYPGTSNDIAIQELEQKYINKLYIFGCNAGHFDVDNNVARTFLNYQSNIQQVDAYDGTIATLKGYSAVLPWKQGDYFYEYVPDDKANIFGWKRLPFGPLKTLEKVFINMRLIIVITGLTTHSEK